MCTREKERQVSRVRGPMFDANVRWKISDFRKRDRKEVTYVPILAESGEVPKLSLIDRSHFPPEYLAFVSGETCSPLSFCLCPRKLHCRFDERIQYSILRLYDSCHPHVYYPLSGIALLNPYGSTRGMFEESTRFFRIIPGVPDEAVCSRKR